MVNMGVTQQTIPQQITVQSEVITFLWYGDFATPIAENTATSAFGQSALQKTYD